GVGGLAARLVDARRPEPLVDAGLVAHAAARQRRAAAAEAGSEARDRRGISPRRGLGRVVAGRRARRSPTCALRSENSSHVGAAPAQTRLALAATCPMPTALSSRVVHHEYSRVDLINPLCILALAAFSVLFIYSAQAYVGGTQWKGQIAWFAI